MFEFCLLIEIFPHTIYSFTKEKNGFVSESNYGESVTNRNWYLGCQKHSVLQFITI
jgi:hypothetical protein